MCFERTGKRSNIKTAMKATAYCTTVFFLLLAPLALLAQTAPASTKAPHEVLAFYYTWYGAPNDHGHAFHWNRVDASKHDISDSTHYPVQGAYNSRDAAVIDRQIDKAMSTETNTLG
jgi:hypothetical protein